MTKLNCHVTTPTKCRRTGNKTRLQSYESQLLNVGFGIALNDQQLDNKGKTFVIVKSNQDSNNININTQGSINQSQCFFVL
jgi:hypothetical protein